MTGERIVICILMVLSFSSFLLGIHVRLASGCSGVERLLYPLCHVNIWHLICNMCCVWTIACSDFRDKWWMWLAGYAVAVCTPALTTGTEGASGIIYCVLGCISWQAASKRKFHLVTMAMILVGLVLPTVIDTWAHVFGYGIGIIIGKIYGIAKERQERWKAAMGAAASRRG